METLADLQWLLWIGLALLLGALEVASLDLVFAMIAGAALVAAAVAALGASLTVQVISFSVAAALLLLVARPVVLRYVKPRVPLVRTGTDGNVGERAEVLEPVTPRSGRVKVRGEVWSARADTGAPTAGALPVGAEVEVVRIDGATAVVRPLPSAEPPGRLAPGDGPSPTTPPASPWSPT